MSQQQQTILKVYSNFNANSVNSTTTFEVLDTHASIPIKINRSFAELQDIGKKNSDYSYNIQLPGTKKNNKFFESFYDVDVQTLYFNPNYKVACDVLINDESYFNGYMRLNKINVKNSAVEYDVTLYNEVGNLFGDIGNLLLKDLDYNDPDYTFNHIFNQGDVVYSYNRSIWGIDGEQPETYFYPIVHNGYLYSGDTVNFSGGTYYDKTNLYTSTEPLGAYTNLAAFNSAGGKNNRINTPYQGIYDNQLKPALSIWNLLKLMFKTYGYTISGDFFNTPWMKSLFMYGYFSSANTKFSYNLQSIQTLPLDGIEIIIDPYNENRDFRIIVCKKYTGIPSFCDTSFVVEIEIKRRYIDDFGIRWTYYYLENYTIPAGTTGVTVNLNQTIPSNTVYRHYETVWDSPVPVADISQLKYPPTEVNQFVNFIDGDPVDFSLVIDPLIKQIDILSSICKKFNLVLIPNPNNTKDIIIEPYSHYVGTGDIWDWTQKLSYDQGFTVEPSLNYIQSNIDISDAEDGDYGNTQFKNIQNRIYGQMNYYGPTDFKSEVKEIRTIFGPELIRQWDTIDNTNNKLQKIKLPLGINYAGSTNTTDGAGTESTNYTYTGVKTKPKLFFNVTNANVFLDSLNEIYDYTKTYKSYQVWVSKYDGTFPIVVVTPGLNDIPVVSHSMPMGIPDQFKINNDNFCLLFNSENNITATSDVPTFNTYTENDAWSTFYQNRIANITNGNTRFIKGKFYLKLNDYKNLKPNDLIKIKDQLFTWNQIIGYNLTDTELTDVELIQINTTPSQYVTRYFKYQYCDITDYTFKFKTDFTNPNILNTNFGYSVTYDYNCGNIYSGNTQPTGYTTSYAILLSGATYYVPYTIREISKDEYDNNGYYDWDTDTMHEHIWSTPYSPYNDGMPTFWINSGSTKEGINLFTDCAQFNSIKTANGIRTIASDYFGPPNFNILNTELNQNIRTETNNNIQIEF